MTHRPWTPSLRALSVSILFTIAAGCAAPPANDVKGLQSALFWTTEDEVGMWPDEWVGKFDNKDFQQSTLICNPGDVIVGVWGAAGDYINRMGFDCETLLPDGTLRGGPYMYATGSRGGSGGQFFETLCPPNYAAYGVIGRADDYVNAIGLRCELAGFQNGPETTNPVGAVDTEIKGGTGGRPFKHTCDRQRLFNKLDLATSDRVNGFGELCTFISNECIPRCNGKQCGPDGCGGSCGSCPGNYACTGSGTCQCVPQCNGKQCGPDGCGGSCGTCGNRLFCTDGRCLADCSCNGKECGPDGCGGSCGSCGAKAVCVVGACEGIDG